MDLSCSTIDQRKKAINNQLEKKSVKLFRMDGLGLPWLTTVVTGILETKYKTK